MTLWTPRDVLISLLRDIDEGNIDVSAVVVCIRHRGEDGDLFTSNMKSAKTLQEAVYLCEMVKFDILSNVRG